MIVAIGGLCALVACTISHRRSINGRSVHDIKVGGCRCVVVAGAQLDDSNTAAGNLRFYADKGTALVVEVTRELSASGNLTSSDEKATITSHESEYGPWTDVAFPVGHCLKPCTIVISGNLRNKRGVACPFPDTLVIGEFVGMAKSLNPRFRELAARFE